ncbi:Small glutamine-rich tetratricopeptide repeat-containing protein 2 [Ceratocystis platani]|uniref:Small glutamine-rich tetratricopeptide repeat-containing protein 2 n=1 Tax=Ceratocystis fimbriata f. sp. platani TaxID=88771 RepID=A0A0F8D829_CERFI|nr:Small glutamine-rich tetratricopeptide repeat-containing protein 2 [Ceratocystis platani]
MSLTSKQRLALAICDYLNTSTTDGTLAADEAENIEIAVNCIADSFKVDPTDAAGVRAATGPQTLLQIFTVYESLRQAKEKTGSPTGNIAAAAAAAAASSSSATPVSAEDKAAAESLKSKGNAAMAAKDYASAISLYSQALELHPSNAIYLSNRAAAHSAAKDHAAAKTDAESAVALDPKYTKGWSRLGLARFALGDARGAMEAYAKGIEYEGNGGSDAMKKGFETAKRRVGEQEGESSADLATREAPVSASAGAEAGVGAGAGGLPDMASMFGGGAGGMPDFGSIMSNPMFQSMAQNLMSNPELMGNLMSNPRLRAMADNMSTGGGMPDVSALMSDPSLAEMAKNLMGGGGAGAGAGGRPGGSA